jgi:hypothetical protein
MFTPTQAAVTGAEATVIIARAGDLRVTPTSGGRLSAPIWLRALARLELAGTSADWDGIWALVRNEDWEARAAHACAMPRAIEWFQGWFETYGLGDFTFDVPAPYEVNHQDAA